MDTFFASHRLSRPRVDGLARLEPYEALPLLARFLDEVPVGRDPERILFLLDDAELAGRSVEHHAAPGAVGQGGSLSGGADRLEDRLPRAPDVEPVFRRRDDDDLVGLLRVVQLQFGLAHRRLQLLDPASALLRRAP